VHYVMSLDALSAGLMLSFNIIWIIGVLSYAMEYFNVICEAWNVTHVWIKRAWTHHFTKQFSFP
jgi:hypothetical protein